MHLHMVVARSFSNLGCAVQLFHQNQARQLMRKDPVAHSQEFVSGSSRIGESVGASNSENDSAPRLVQLLFEQLRKGHAVATHSSLVQEIQGVARLG